jgi:hypothetical protein
MKKLLVTSVLILFVIMSSADLKGMEPFRPPKDSNPGAVGVPLDGALLAVLGAAGVAYFAGKKKKNNSGD